MARMGEPQQIAAARSAHVLQWFGGVARMKPIREWKDQPEQRVFDVLPELVEGRGGEPTLKVGRVLLHSRYQPCDEARRLVESAELDRNRPVLVIGLGLGYHIEALQAYGVSELAVVEPDPAVLQIAAQTRLGDADFPAAVGDPEPLATDPEFVAFCSRRPQIFVHPATARLHEAAVSDLVVCASRAALRDRRLRVAVVGPMYGGSLPIAEYLARAFERLGHSALFVDNRKAWAIYQDVMDGIETKPAANQLCGLLSNFLNEWSYARVMEFAPDICIVMAQAPVGPKFPLRLAKQGVVSAFWFVENWRHMAYWKDIAPYYDVFFHIQPGEFEAKLSDIGCGCHAFMPTGCDPEIHRPRELTSEERDEYGCDMAFAGAGYFNRVELFKGLTDYDFKIWGVNWDVRELFPHLCHPEERFDAERYARIVAGAKINLNLHSSAYHDGVDPQCDAINPRVFEIAACGGFQLCDPCRNL